MTFPDIILFAGTEINWYNRSAGVYRLATELENQGHSVQVIPNCTLLSKQGYKDVFRKYASNRLLWIGFSTSFLKTSKASQRQHLNEQWTTDTHSIMGDVLAFNFATDPQTNLNNQQQLFIYDNDVLISILEEAQVYNKNCKLVLGGANSGIFRNFFHPDLYLIHGNAERSSIEFTANCKQGIYQPVHVPNDTWDNVEFKTSSIRYKLTDYIDSNEWLPIEVARGCSFRCAYCTYDRRDNRDSFKDPQSLKKEIINLYETFGTTKFIIMDDLYNDSREKVNLLHEQVWSQLPFEPELAGYLRLDMLWNQPDQARLLLEDGWKFASFGVETMHDRAGSKIGKGLGKRRIQETIKMCNSIWNQQLIMSIMLIAGLPFEPAESIEEGANWLENEKEVLTYVYQPLHLTPPEFTKLHLTSDISRQPSDFNITWTGKYKWVNDQGITNSWANEFCSRDHNKKLHMHFSGYADQRGIGVDHDSIVNVLRNKDNKSRNLWQGTRLSLVSDRLRKIIS